MAIFWPCVYFELTESVLESSIYDNWSLLRLLAGTCIPPYALFEIVFYYFDI